MLLLDRCVSSGIVVGAQCGWAAPRWASLQGLRDKRETTLTTKHSSINTVRELDCSRGWARTQSQGLEVCGITSLTKAKSQTDTAERLTPVLVCDADVKVLYRCSRLHWRGFTWKDTNGIASSLTLYRTSQVICEFTWCSANVLQQKVCKKYKLLHIL